MDTLDTLRDGGRVVGVVSHVPELADPDPHPAARAPRSHGSRTTSPSPSAPIPLRPPRAVPGRCRCGPGSARFVPMSAPGLDPTFNDLPHRRLGEVALARAQELGASHADFRFERNRYQYLGARDGVLQTASDAEDLGFAVRVVHGGAWGFASGIVLTDDEARRVAETAVAVAKVAAAMTTTPVELAPEPVHDDVTWVSGYDVNPLDVPDSREGGAARRLDRAASHRGRRRARHGLPPAGAGEQVLRRPRGHADHAAAGAAAAGVRGHRRGRADRHLRLDGLHRPAGRAAAGSTSPASHWDWDAELAEVPRAARGEAEGTQRRGRDLRPRRPPLQPLADHPRVHRPRHRARPGAGLRGQLRRHVVRHLRQARHAAVRLPGDERAGRPHPGARPRHRRLRRRGRRRPRAGTSSATACSSATSSTARWATSSRSSTTAAPTAAPTPTPPATSRSSGWPTSR